MKVVKISYDQEGDILEVRFTTGTMENRIGIGLNEDVTLFCDLNYSELHGLTVLAYSKLISHPPQPTTELNEAPDDIREKVRRLLQSKNIQPFLSLENGDIRLHDVRVAQLAAT